MQNRSGLSLDVCRSQVPMSEIPSREARSKNRIPCPLSEALANEPTVTILGHPYRS